MYASVEYKIGVVRTCVSHICLRECVRVPRWLLRKHWWQLATLVSVCPGGSRLVVRCTYLISLFVGRQEQRLGYNSKIAHVSSLPFHGDNGAMFRGQFSATTIMIEI